MKRSGQEDEAHILFNIFFPSTHETIAPFPSPMAAALNLAAIPSLKPRFSVSG